MKKYIVCLLAIFLIITGCSREVKVIVSDDEDIVTSNEVVNEVTNEDIVTSNEVVNEVTNEVVSNTTDDDKNTSKHISISGSSTEVTITKKKSSEQTTKKSNNEQTAKKETIPKDTPPVIKSVTGNATNWTNKDVVLTVTVDGSSKYTYSFDNGNTYQLSQTYNVKKNGTYYIKVKDSKGTVSQSTKVVVNKIDKTSPTITYSISDRIDGKNSTIIKVTFSTYDGGSGVNSIIFNGDTYTDKDTFEITKAGSYAYQACDKVGNCSDKAYVKITSDAFKSSKPLKTFTVSLMSNGNNLEKNSVSCSSYDTSCEVTLPKIITNNNIAVGYGTSAGSTSAKYKVGDEVTISSDLTLYAITKKTVTVSFVANGATSISATSKSATCYNANSCEITFPSITTSNGKEALGWNTNKNATSATYKVNTSVYISNNSTYYAITKKTVTATFIANGAKSIGANSKSCTYYNTSTSCAISPPTITLKAEGSVKGWSTVSSALSGISTTNGNFYLSSNMTYYAITQNIYTVTFEASTINDIEYYNAKCTAYNSDKCSVKLPWFNKKGGYSAYWGTDPIVRYDLTGKAPQDSWFNRVGSQYSVNSDITLYPNPNTSSYYTSPENLYKKFRNFNIGYTAYVGSTFFEFEVGVPENARNKFLSEMRTAYKEMPWLFNVRKKVFVLTSKTYNAYSKGYGVTIPLSTGFIHIDLQYDANIDEISVNASIHELAHAWDFNYLYKNKKYLSSNSDFDSFFDNLSKPNHGLGYVEGWASAVTDYYWHILGHDPNHLYYMLKNKNDKLTSSELTALKNIVEKYSK